MNNFVKNIIIILITIGLIWYAAIVISNWQLVTGGKLWLGLIKLLIPISTNVFIYLILYEKISLFKKWKKLFQLIWMKAFLNN